MKLAIKITAIFILVGGIALAVIYFSSPKELSFYFPNYVLIPGEKRVKGSFYDSVETAYVPPNFASPSIGEAINPPLKSTGSANGNSAVNITFVSRIHHIISLQNTPEYDDAILSPKSVRFSPDGRKVYVNSLENSKTIIYDAKTKKRLSVIDQKRNNENGKPVESEFSHDGKYLWTPYYRFENDPNALLPSAVAIIDTDTDKIVRILPTGAVSKNIAISPKNNFAAVTNWGENTITIFDISGKTPDTFSYLDTFIVGKKFTPVGTGPINRDQICGLCVRGIVFSPDEKMLFVGEMGSTGIAAFDMESHKYLGTVSKPGLQPRDLLLSPDGTELYITSYSEKSLERVSIDMLRSAFLGADGKNVEMPEIFDGLYLSGSPRTMRLSQNGGYGFIALNNSAEVVVIDMDRWKIINRVRGDGYLVGLDVSPDDSEVWTTSQGINAHGGNSIGIFSITYN